MGLLATVKILTRRRLLLFSFFFFFFVYFFVVKYCSKNHRYFY